MITFFMDDNKVKVTNEVKNMDTTIGVLKVVQSTRESCEVDTGTYVIIWIPFHWNKESFDSCMIESIQEIKEQFNYHYGREFSWYNDCYTRVTSKGIKIVYHRYFDC
jgi:hypothetical protein